MLSWDGPRCAQKVPRTEQSSHPSARGQRSRARLWLPPAPQRMHERKKTKEALDQAVPCDWRRAGRGFFPHPETRAARPQVLIQTLALGAVFPRTEEHVRLWKSLVSR